MNSGRVAPSHSSGIRRSIYFLNCPSLLKVSNGRKGWNGSSGKQSQRKGISFHWWFRPRLTDIWEKGSLEFHVSLSATSQSFCFEVEAQEEEENEATTSSTWFDYVEVEAGSSLLARKRKTMTGSDPFYIDERVGINAFMVSYLLRI